MSAENRRVLPARPGLLAAVALLLVAAGCRQNMHNQHKVKTLAASDFFADGQGARPIPAHTVARGDLREGWAYTGVDAASKPVAELPFPLTREVLLLRARATGCAAISALMAAFAARSIPNGFSPSRCFPDCRQAT